MNEPAWSAIAAYIETTVFLGGNPMKLRLIFSCCLVAIAAAMTGCGATGGGYNLPPASRLMEPGPGVGGPGPGVISMPTPGIEPASYAGPMVSAPPSGGGMSSEVQVLFARPEAMQVSFGTGSSYSSTPIITPGRQNFMQGGVYRLKVAGVPGREGTELYPTLEIGPPTRQTAAYLAHNAIPVQFTEEDFDQVVSGNFVTKVIYLPEPDFQELALAGVETLVSTRLDPGVDPIVEADRRGAILAVVRIGNKDMEVPGGASVSPAYGAVPAGTGIVPAGYQSAAAIPTTTAGGVVQASLACDSCPSCASADGSCPSGGCLIGPGAAGFYCANSTPRGGYGPGGLPPGLAGGGQYGMPITGTPIALPGPPHVPLGVPAGLKQHVMRNWTKRAIPDPVSKMKINVKQRPGLSYPHPPSRAWVVEDTIHAAPHFSNRHFGIAPAGGVPRGGAIQAAGDGCPDGSCTPASGGGLLGGLLGH